ncbi:hypothetical protein [Clostridium sp.]|uniref:hypothetical protein n=1 Tax=Clostridium sp. TaxID=1506 RepID=UPI003217273D
MSKRTQVESVDWNDILEKFANYNGSVTAFCNEYGVDKRKLYYRRKKSQVSNQQLFHAVNLNTDSRISASHKYPQDIEKELKIEIGKATIFIPSDDLQLLSNIIKELQSSCLI